MQKWHRIINEDCAKMSHEKIVRNNHHIFYGHYTSQDRNTAALVLYIIFYPLPKKSTDLNLEYLWKR